MKALAGAPGPPRGLSGDVEAVWAAERAATVRFLRREAPHVTGDIEGAMLWAASVVSRGEHLDAERGEN